MNRLNKLCINGNLNELIRLLDSPREWGHLNIVKYFLSDSVQSKFGPINLHENDELCFRHACG